MACHILPQLLKCIEYFVCLIAMILRLSPLPHRIIHRARKIDSRLGWTCTGAVKILVGSRTSCCELATADLVECAVVDQMGAATVTLN